MVILGMTAMIATIVIVTDAIAAIDVNLIIVTRRTTGGLRGHRMIPGRTVTALRQSLRIQLFHKTLLIQMSE
jgi:hypothetical protein